MDKRIKPNLRWIVFILVFAISSSALALNCKYCNDEKFKNSAEGLKIGDCGSEIQASNTGCKPASTGCAILTIESKKKKPNCKIPTAPTFDGGDKLQQTDKDRYLKGCWNDKFDVKLFESCGEVKYCDGADYCNNNLTPVETTTTDPTVDPPGLNLLYIVIPVACVAIIILSLVVFYCWYKKKHPPTDDPENTEKGAGQKMRRYSTDSDSD